MSDEERPIIIKKVTKVSGGHHGGAWKIAYADFITAMMAFFLLMWLISATTEEQKLGIADYFRPTTTSNTQSGADGVLGGRSVAEQGAQSSGAVLVSIPNSPPQMERKDGSDADDSPKQRDEFNEQLVAAQEEKLFLEAEQKLNDAISNNPDLSDLNQHILIDRTPEGLRIQVVDRDGRSTFKPGTATIKPHGRKILREVAVVIASLPNRITIAGHTDATPFRGKASYSNWELSSDRANSSRRELLLGSLPRDRIYRVSGRAATEPLLPDDPFQDTNRRITIVLLREAPVLPPSYSQ
ncbi:MAG: flagellar motor protein MotB [Sphingomonadales bacterium]